MVRTRNPAYFLLEEEIQDYNVVVDGKYFFDQPVKSYVRTYDNIQKITTVQGDYYKTDCLLNCPCFKKIKRC